MKALIVTMPNRIRWSVPVCIIAEDRARHLAKRDSARGYGTYDAVYAEEYANTLVDEEELLDWAANNMNWSDVQPHALPHVELPVTDEELQDAWVNGDHEIIEVEEIVIA